jgi:hypothetical protein
MSGERAHRGVSCGARLASGPACWQSRQPGCYRHVRRAKAAASASSVRRTDLRVHRVGVRRGAAGRVLGEPFRNASARGTLLAALRHHGPKLTSAASTVEQIETEAVRGTDRADFTAISPAGQIMPKNFTFYNPDSHKRIIRALEEYAPAAVIAATGTDPGLVGSQYPFPLFEDGDLDVPERVSERCRRRAACRSRRCGSEAFASTRTGPYDRRPRHATMQARRRPGRIVSRPTSTAARARRAHSTTRAVWPYFCGSRSCLADHASGPSIELVPFNGEDNYANPGEMLWAADNEGTFRRHRPRHQHRRPRPVRGTTNHVSFYGCPPDTEAVSEAMAIAAHPGDVRGPAVVPERSCHLRDSTVRPGPCARLERHRAASWHSTRTPSATRSGWWIRSSSWHPRGSCEMW